MIEYWVMSCGCRRTYAEKPKIVSSITDRQKHTSYNGAMARLDILVHGGCLSEGPIRRLALDLQHELPKWQIDVRTVESVDRDRLGVVAFPVFLCNGHVVATGFPQKDWLLAELWARENMGE